MGIRCADHVTPSIRKNLTLTSPRSGGRLVGIVRLRTKFPEFVYCFSIFMQFFMCTYVGKCHKLRGWPCVPASRLVCNCKEGDRIYSSKGEVLISEEGIMAVVL
jgi:hypothetical protein